MTQSLPGTPIVIQQNHPSSGNGIKLTGTIDNPVGSTELLSDGGGIVANANSLVRTNTLDIKSENDVGSSASRLKVDLVRSVGQPTDLDIDATGKVWLDLDAGLMISDTGDIDLSTVHGSIVDGLNESFTNIQAAMWE